MRRERTTRKMINASRRRKAIEPPTAPAIKAVLSAEAGGVDVTGDAAERAVLLVELDVAVTGDVDAAVELDGTVTGNAEERAVLLVELDVAVTGDVDAEERARLLVELDNTIVVVEGSVDVEAVVVLVDVVGAVVVRELDVVIGQLAGGRDEQEQLAGAVEQS